MGMLVASRFRKGRGMECRSLPARRLWSFIDQDMSVKGIHFNPLARHVRVQVGEQGETPNYISVVLYRPDGEARTGA